MSNFDTDMNLETQLQVAFSMNAELKDQLASLREVNWSVQERLRVIDERHEKELESQRQFYENMMESLRADMDRQLEKQHAALALQFERQEANLKTFFEKQLEELRRERDAARSGVIGERGKRYGRSSERNAGRRGKDDDDNRPASKAGYVDPESERDKEKSASECSTLDIEKLQKKLKRRYPGAEIEVKRIDYVKSVSYLEPGSPDYHFHSLDEYFTLSEGEYFRTGKEGKIEKSYYRVIVRYPEKIEEHVYEAATVRSKDKDDYKTTDILTDKARIIPNCMFSENTLRYILMEKYMYNVPFDQIIAKLRDLGLKISSNVLGKHVHNALDWIAGRMTSCWESAVKKSYISMIDETRVLVGCDGKCEDKEKKKRQYKFKYIWGIYAKSIKLSWFIYEQGSRGAKVIQPFLKDHIGFYTTDGYAVYKIYDSHPEDADSKRKRSACLVHIRCYFVDALTEDYLLALWFIEEISKIFTIEYECSKAGKTGAARLVERLKPGNTADIMSRIEAKLIELRDAGQTECGEKLLKAVRYALSEWPAMKRVLENGDIELSNNLCEQMMRHIKMNLKTAGNIGSEGSAKHNAFMYSVIESCRMAGIKVDIYLHSLLDGLKKAAIGEDLTHLLPCYCTQ